MNVPPRHDRTNPFGEVIGHHVEVAIDDVGVLHPAAMSSKHCRSRERYRPNSESQPRHRKQAKALVHGIVNARVLFRERRGWRPMPNTSTIFTSRRSMRRRLPAFPFRDDFAAGRIDGEADRRLGIVAGCYDADLHRISDALHVYRGQSSLSKHPAASRPSRRGTSNSRQVAMAIGSAASLLFGHLDRRGALAPPSRR